MFPWYPPSPLSLTLSASSSAGFAVFWWKGLDEYITFRTECSKVSRSVILSSCGLFFIPDLVQEEVSLIWLSKELTCEHSKMSLKIILVLHSSPFSILNIFLGFFLVFQISWIFCVRIILRLIIYFLKVSISPIMPSIPEFSLPSLIFCWWGLPLRFMFEFSNLLFSDFSQVEFSLLIQFLLSGLGCFIHFLLLFICYFIDYFKVFIIFLLIE